jgi:hypothetical protein
MTPYKLTLENWLLKLNRGLTSNDLYKHEELIGKAMQLRKLNTTNEDIKEYLIRANTIIPKSNLQAINTFWMKQKKYAAVQRDFQRFELFRPKIWAASFFYYISYIKLFYFLLIGKRIKK